MDLHQLMILRELRALGSVTAVAEQLHVTPSAVSQHLAALQREFAVPLTRREGRIRVLTAAGRVLADSGVDVIDAMAAARSAVERFEEDAGGIVSLSGFHSAGQALFGHVVAELAAQPEAPELRLADEDVAQQDFAALTSRYDLVLAHRMEHSSPWPAAGIHVITLAREPLDVAVAETHPLAGRATLSPADVAGERWVTSRAGYSPNDVLTAVAAVAERHLEVVHRINDYGAVSAVVASGTAIGLLPRYTSTHRPAGLVLRPLTGIGTRRTIDVLIRPEALRRRSVRLVVTALRSAMERLVGG